MGKTLIVAEKPSVGRDIAKVLEATTRGNRCLINSKYVISWAFGHLVSLANPEEIDDKYKKWSMDQLPIMPEVMQLKLAGIKGSIAQFEAIKHWMLSDEVDDIICATDAGREGELIFRWIYEFAGCTKPIKRLWISSMTDEAIKEGFANLKPGSEYESLFESARARASADWIVGMNASRAFTLTYERLLSVGRVQSPTLAILVNRELERINFVPEEYYELWAVYPGFKACWFDPKAKENITRIAKTDYEKFKKLSQDIVGKTAVVSDIENKLETRKPPQLYDLTSLQRDANYNYGWSAARTLQMAQALYEKRKLITYPRTDSKYLSGDMYPLLKSRLAKLNAEPYTEYVEEAITSERNIFGRVINDAFVTDHHAIIPTGRKAPKSLDENEKKLYDLIVRRFIAIFLEDQETERVRVITDIDKEKFESKGSVVIEPGWSKVYEDVKKKRNGNGEQKLPKLEIGDERLVKKSELKEKKTKPPARYSDATLLSAMEHAGRMVEDDELREQMKENGLGTPATRAAIIERLIQVRYVKRMGKTLAPTEKGVALVSVLPEELKLPETTGKWEKALEDIRSGEEQAENFMDGIKRMTCEVIEKSKIKKEVKFPEEAARPDPDKPREVLGTCPACKGEIMENSKAFYCSNWRRTKCKFSVWKNDKKSDRPDMTPDMMKKLLKDKVLEFEEGVVNINEKSPFYEWNPKEGTVKE
jgi:DNA topoisomerase-3